MCIIWYFLTFEGQKRRGKTNIFPLPSYIIHPKAYGSSPPPVS